MSEQDASNNPGQQLQRAREAQGRTTRSVAASLNLAAGVIEALEEGDEANLPPSTFVRGYLRGYARLVGLDEDEIVAAYNSRQEAGGGPEQEASRRDEGFGPAEQLSGARREEGVSTQFGGQEGSEQAASSAGTQGSAPPAYQRGAQASAPAGGGDKENAEGLAGGQTATTGSAWLGSSEERYRRTGERAEERDAEVTKVGGTSYRRPASAVKRTGTNSASRTANKRSRLVKSLVAGGVTLLLVLGGLLVWLLLAKQDGEQQTQSEGQSETQTTLEGEDEVHGPAAQRVGIGTAGVADGSGESGGVELDGLDLGPLPDVTSAIEEFEAERAEPGLVIRVAEGQQSWMEISADGDRRVFRLVQGPETIELEQADEYIMVIGNAPAVEVEHYGEEFDLSPFTRQDVARVTLTKE